VGCGRLRTIGIGCDPALVEVVERPTQFGFLGRLAIALALASFSAVQVQGAKNSAPAQVMMVATMPPTFSLQAAPATLAGATGTVQAQSGGHGRLLIRGQLRGQGGAAVVRIPVSLAANTRSFLVRARAEGATSHATIYLESPQIMGRRAPMRRSAILAMGMAKDRGFFALSQPLHSTVEIVFEDLPRQQNMLFSIALTMHALGY
jgi:hypothetical protein